MGFFFKALAAIVTADAVDRHTRSRPKKYWYPNQPDPPSPDGQSPQLAAVAPPARPASSQAPGVGWDFRHPERPT